MQNKAEITSKHTRGLFSRTNQCTHLLQVLLTNSIKITGYLSYLWTGVSVVFTSFIFHSDMLDYWNILTENWLFKNAIIQEFYNSGLLSNQRKLHYGRQNTKFYWSSVLGAYVWWKRNLLNLSISWLSWANVSTIVSME